MSDGRDNERFDLELPVRLKIQGADTASTTRNISASGALISSRLPLPEGTTLEIDIDIPMDVLKDVENARVALKGRVVRVTDTDTALAFDRDDDGPCDADGLPGEGENLTRRQKEILRLIAGGLSNREIADTLFISPHTVKTHLQNIFSKIKVKQRLQAALWAARHL